MISIGGEFETFVTGADSETTNCLTIMFAVTAFEARIFKFTITPVTSENIAGITLAAVTDFVYIYTLLCAVAVIF